MLRELAEWFKAVSLSFTRLVIATSVRIGYSLITLKGKECSLIGKIGSFNLQILGSNPSTLEINQGRGLIKINL